MDQPTAPPFDADRFLSEVSRHDPVGWFSRGRGMPVTVSEYAVDATGVSVGWHRPLWRRLLSGRTLDLYPVNEPAILQAANVLIAHPTLWHRVRAASLELPEAGPYSPAVAVMDYLHPGLRVAYWMAGGDDD